MQYILTAIKVTCIIIAYGYFNIQRCDENHLCQNEMVIQKICTYVSLKLKRLPMKNC